MTTDSATRDWFDELWDRQVPLMYRLHPSSAALKRIARSLMDEALKVMAKKAGAPDGVKAIVAFARIQAIVTGAKGVLDAPDPTPEQVAEAVERLVQRVKP
jgi:microsomal dipeptidase-like Zn-dependent dipeptidase